MKSMSELLPLMAELIEECPTFVLTPRGVAIIDEIADYAEQTAFYIIYKDEGKIFNDLNAKAVYAHLLDRIDKAPTRLHAEMSIILVMPFVRERLRMELAEAYGQNKEENNMAKPYKECPNCGAHLDSGEKCDCCTAETGGNTANERRIVTGE